MMIPFSSDTAQGMGGYYGNTVHKTLHSASGDGSAEEGQGRVKNIHFDTVGQGGSTGTFNMKE